MSSCFFRTAICALMRVCAALVARVARPVKLFCEMVASESASWAPELMRSRTVGANDFDRDAAQASENHKAAPGIVIIDLSVGIEWRDESAHSTFAPLPV